MSINIDLINSLAINIDLNDNKSWNPDNELVIKSINGLNGISINELDLPDFGLTAIDNGLASDISDHYIGDPFENKLKLNRIGYYSLINDMVTYDGYDMSPITGTSVGNYLNLNNGYFQGFFKLEGFDYEVLPARYINGITIETLIEILPESNGIFYYMGTRAEDKYVSAYLGETTIVSADTVNYNSKSQGKIYALTGITTSNGNYLASYDKLDARMTAFPRPEESSLVIDNEINQIDNLSNNVISFEITVDKKLGCKYIDKNGSIIYIVSPNTITRTGWTLIDICYAPDDKINHYDYSKYKCFDQRKGSLNFYINGNLFWSVADFDEFYFRGLNCDTDKQIGVPYNISWGGGSFGLKNSLHFSDFDKSGLVIDESKNNLFIERNFNNSYIGNIQKLRVYDRALLGHEILMNANLIARSNSAYNISVAIGGRLIRRLS